MALNRFTTALAEICREHVFEEKWLLAPSRRVARQWIEALARDGVPVVNIRLGYNRRRDDTLGEETADDQEFDYVLDDRHDTLVNLARYLTRAILARDGLTFITGLELEVAAELAWRRVPPDAAVYFQEATASSGFYSALARTIRDYRLGALNPDDLSPEKLEVTEKGRALRELLRAHEDILREKKMVDYAAVLALAVDRLRHDPQILPPETLILYPKYLARDYLEREFLAALPAGRIRELDVDEPAGPDDQLPSVDYADTAILAYVKQPAAAPPPKNDGSVNIFRAIGETNEVREVLRRVLAEEVPFDQVEIIYTDADAYLGSIYETAERLFREDSPLSETAREDTQAQTFGLPVTFSDGIPANYSGPGRALRAWVEWSQQDFPQQILVRMIQDGLLEITGGETSPSYAFLAGELRRAGIGKGRERYVSQLDAVVAALEQRANAKTIVEDEEGEPNRELWLDKRRSAAALLRDRMSALLGVTPDAEAPTASVLEASKEFLQGFARTRTGIFDDYARRALIDSIDGLLHWVKQDALANLNAWDWLRELAAETPVGGAGPRPGCLYVSNLFIGGHSGRPYTFIVGLDDGRFPGAGLGEPILLDEERDRLSPNLPTGGKRLDERETEFARLLARLRGRVTLSYSCYDFARGRESFPAACIINAYRLIARPATGDLKAMLSWLGPPASFRPDGETKALDMSEWWLWRLLGEESGIDNRAEVGKYYPNLARGLSAQRERESDVFTEYDGFVPEAGAALVREDPPFSANRLGIIGACPRHFFFEYTLGLKPPEDYAVNEDEWLDALTEGFLLHGVFKEYMKKLIQDNRRPEIERDSPIIDELLENAIEYYRLRYPPARETVFLEQVDRLKTACRYFLLKEEQQCRTNTPKYCELNIGMEPDQPPVLLTLHNGKRIRGRGRIDRVDETADGSLSIWDYKTGAKSRYEKAPPFNQGRLIQSIYYITLLETALAAQGKGDVAVAAFGYFFPGVKGKGTRLSWTAEELEEGKRILARLYDIAATGSYAATDNPEDCLYCDYGFICINEPTSSFPASKLENERNEALTPFRELRSRAKKTK